MQSLRYQLHAQSLLSRNFMVKLSSSDELHELLSPNSAPVLLRYISSIKQEQTWRILYIECSGQIRLNLIGVNQAKPKLAMRPNQRPLEPFLSLLAPWVVFPHEQSQHRELLGYDVPLELFLSLDAIRQHQVLLKNFKDSLLLLQFILLGDRFILFLR